MFRFRFALVVRERDFPGLLVYRFPLFDRFLPKAFPRFVKDQFFSVFDHERFFRRLRSAFRDFVCVREQFQIGRQFLFVFSNLWMESNLDANLKLSPACFRHLVRRFRQHSLRFRERRVQLKRHRFDRVSQIPVVLPSDEHRPFVRVILVRFFPEPIRARPVRNREHVLFVHFSRVGGVPLTRWRRRRRLRPQAGVGRIVMRRRRVMMMMHPTTTRRIIRRRFVVVRIRGGVRIPRFRHCYYLCVVVYVGLLLLLLLLLRSKTTTLSALIQ